MACVLVPAAEAVLTTAAEMLHEMATAGVGMAALCTAVWGIMLVVSSKIEKRAELPASE